MGEITTLNVDEARQLTDQIKVALARVAATFTLACDLIEDAYSRRAWAALGHETWDAYCEHELGPLRLRLPPRVPGRGSREPALRRAEHEGDLLGYRPRPRHRGARAGRSPRRPKWDA